MLYLPQILNQHGLFQKLNGLKKQDPRLGDLKEAIFNHGTDAIIRMEKIRRLNDLVIKEFTLFADQMKLSDESLIVFSSQSMGALLGEISPLLSTLRILQNRVLALVSLWEGLPLPASVSNFCKKAEKYDVSEKVKNSILAYWETSGKHVKFYRDVDQHDFNRSELSSRYFMKLKPHMIAYAELPDYQKRMKKSEFSYEEQVNAFEFLDDACFELHSLIEELAEEYGAKAQPHGASVRMDQLGDLTPWRERTLAVMYEQNLEDQDGKKTLNLKGIRFDQNKDGQMVLQQMILDGDNLVNAKKLYGDR